MHDGCSQGAVEKTKVVDFVKRFGSVQKIFLIGALIGVVILMTCLNPRFLSFENILNISRQMSINLVIAVGMTFCIISGGIDLSVGSIGIMAGCLTGLVLDSSNSVVLALGVGLLSGILFGGINGVIIAKLRVTPFICTLGTMTVARGIALWVTGGDIIGGFPEAFNFIGVGFIGGMPVPVIITAIVVVLGWILLSKTEFGLGTYAIGGNFKAARLAGLKNDNILIKIYTLAGFLAAVGGIILTARVVSAQPALMQTTNMDCIAAVVVGGTSLMGGSGTMMNTVLGSILMACLINGLNIIGIGYEWQLMVIGVIIIIAVALDMLSHRKEV
ncbi:MAG: ABC transporter permease [Negativicutes bacterium]|nr:ABC transporter permease [Negativicutes bacterium]